jgi:hypothetical protein
MQLNNRRANMTENTENKDLEATENTADISAENKAGESPARGNNAKGNENKTVENKTVENKTDKNKTDKNVSTKSVEKESAKSTQSNKDKVTIINTSKNTYILEGGKTLKPGDVQAVSILIFDRLKHLGLKKVEVTTQS